MEAAPTQPPKPLKQQILEDPQLKLLYTNSQNYFKKQEQAKKPQGRKTRAALALGTGLIAVSSIADSLHPPSPAQLPILGQATSAQAAQIGETPAPIQKTEPTKTPEATKTPEPPKRVEQLTILDRFIKPMIEKAQKRRAERAKADPEYYHRVDKELNEDRINILLFFTGNFLRRDLPTTLNSANQILSYNTKTKTLDLISITGDVMGPEVEKYTTSKGQPPKRYSINNSFDTGRGLGGSEDEGFNLMRKTFEDATGLSMDFEGVGTNGTVKDFIDQVFGPLEIEAPYDFFAYKINIDGKEYPDYTFRTGKQNLDGTKVVQYISADDYERHWAGRLHHHRKHIVIDALRVSLRKNLENPFSKAAFVAKLTTFMKSHLDSGNLRLDFNIGDVLDFKALLDPGRPLGLDAVKEGQSVLIVDPVYEGEGVVMVKTDAEKNPKSKADLAAGKYPDLWWLQIPPNSNPDTKDLVTNYWGVSGGPREIIRRKLLPDTASSGVEVAKVEKIVKTPVTLKEAPEIKLPMQKIADSNNPAHWDGNTLFVFNSGPEGIWRSQGSDLSHLTPDAKPVVFDNKELNKFTWMEATYKDGDTLYGFYHREPSNPFPQIKREIALTAPRIGAAKSLNNGATWQDLGIIIDGPQDFNLETKNTYFAGGNGDFSALPDEKKEFFYFFLTSYAKEPAQQGVAVARMRYEDLSNPKGKIYKWYEGKWQQDALGGVTPVFPAQKDVHKDGAIFFWGPAVHFNTKLNTYVMILNHADEGNFSQEGIYISFNPDLSNPQGWSIPQKIDNPKSPDYWYPQVIGTDTARKETDKRMGQVGRLFVRGNSDQEILLE